MCPPVESTDASWLPDQEKKAVQDDVDGNIARIMAKQRAKQEAEQQKRDDQRKEAGMCVCECVIE
jgi:hypothetical protein